MTPKTKSSIDWDAVNQRLSAARLSLVQGQTMSDSEIKRILTARAKILAQKPAPAAGDSLEVVEFTLASERYAFAAEFVHEVYSLEDLTPLPCTPAFVLGIINLRGSILSVIDIKKFFDLPQTALSELNKIIILESAKMTFGIMVDHICGVHHILCADIQPALPTLTGVREEYLLGVTAQRLVILDAGKLLTDQKLIVQEKVGQ